MTLFALLFACGTGSVVLETPLTEDTGSTGDDTGSDDTGGEDTGDTEPEAHPAAGVWLVEYAMEIPDWRMDICEGEVELVVSDEGTFEAISECEPERGREVEVLFAGEITDDGAVAGLVEFELNLGGGGGGWTLDIEADLEGEFGDDTVELDWQDTIESDRSDADLEGEGEGERQ